MSFTSAESSGQAMAEGSVPRALEQGADRGVGGVLSPTKGILLWSASRLPGYGASESYAPQRLDLHKRLELRTPVRSGCNRPTLNFQHGHVYLTLLALRYSGSPRTSGFSLPL